MTHDTRTRRRRALALAALAGIAAGLTGCDDDLFSFKWDDQPKTAVVYSLARPELHLPSGFSFVEQVPVLVQSPGATGVWDVALDTEDASLVLLAPAALGVPSTGGIAVLETPAFDEVLEAPDPESTAYESDAPVVLEMGKTYVVRTGRRQCSFASNGVFFAKLEPVVIDALGGVLTFRYVASPICNSRDFTSPD